MIAATVTVGGDLHVVEIIALVASGVLSGIGGQWLAGRRARRLQPFQEEELKATAVKAAVETVESALHVARERISTLEDQVNDLSRVIGSLEERLRTAAADREHIYNDLNKALVERAELQQQLIEVRVGKVLTTTEAIVISDLATGVISYANEGVFSLLGYTAPELIAKHIDMLVPERRRKPHEVERQGFAENPHTREMGEDRGVKLEALTRQGVTIPVEISLHPTGDGRVIALIRRRSSQPEQPQN